MDQNNPSNQQPASPIQPPPPPQSPPSPSQPPQSSQPSLPSQPTQPAHPAQPAQKPQEQIKILLVEDDIFLRDIYFEILSQEGFTVLTADDGEAGLKLGQDNPDAKLMLLDIMLPKMHGIDLLKALKADPKSANFPVVILSNLTEQRVIQEALKAGAAGFLVKVKYTPPQVLEKVKEFIKFHQKHMA